jgi:Nif-specific regulatory protein
VLYSFQSTQKEAALRCETCTIGLLKKEVSLLYEIAKLLTDVADLKQVMEKAITILKRELKLQRSAIYLFEPDTSMLCIFASIDLTPEQQKIGSYRLGEGATGIAGESKEPVVIENVHNNILFLNKTGARRGETISYVAVPMLVKNELVGVLSANLNSSSETDFDETIRILTIVSSMFAQAKFVHQRIQNEKKRLSDENSYYKEEVLKASSFENIIGKSKEILTVFEILKKVAPSKATILIRGETGTGKELIASAIHNLSTRREGPLIKLNCAAISETLLESELFGHEKGAFTDAKEMRKGRFELADQGTLFLDEIGDISPALQVKLLRVMQEQEFERVGGAKSIKVDVRLVAATNRDLEAMVKAGTFREDLYYRLNVIPLVLPPLRKRGMDINLLCNHFLEKYAKEHHKTLFFTNEARGLLRAYPWPGNIRELENLMERIVLLADTNAVDDRLVASLLPKITLEDDTFVLPQEAPRAPKPTTKASMEEMEKDAITHALITCKGIQSKAAAMLGISPRQIGYKIKKYNIVY